MANKSRSSIMRSGTHQEVWDWDDRELIKAYDSAVKNWRRPQPAGTGVVDTPGPGPWIEVTEADNNNQVPIPESDCVDNDNISAFPSAAEATIDSSSEHSAPANESNVGNWEGDASVMNSSMPQSRFPVPPVPISMTQRDGSVDFGRGELSSLLMSWYMAGYHAGFYDAKQELQASTSDPSRRSKGGIRKQL